MRQPEKSKRIVSKVEYAYWLIKKGSLALLGNSMAVWAALGGSVAGICLFIFIPIMSMGYWLSAPGTDAASIGMGAGVCLMVLLLFLLLYRIGVKMSVTAATMEEVRPFSHANTAHLPLVDSLVRASSEPQQESILLRASLYSQQTPADQLLRSVEE